MLKINPIHLPGAWFDGYALDLHTLSSTPSGEDPSGHPRFDNRRTEVGEAIYQLKYHDVRGELERLAETVSSFVGRTWPDLVEGIVVVPPTTTRPAQPIDLVAVAISRRLQLPYLSWALVTVPGGLPLKSVTDPVERARLLEGRFEARTRGVEGRQLLLLDDLYRSGATATAATRALVAAGAQKIYFLALTKTRVHR